MKINNIVPKMINSVVFGSLLIASALLFKIGSYDIASFTLIIAGMYVMFIRIDKIDTNIKRLAISQIDLENKIGECYGREMSELRESICKETNKEQ